MTRAKYLFSFVVEHAGHTVVEEVVASTMCAAIKRWATTSTAVPGVDPERLFDPPSLVDGTKNVWCLSLLDSQDRLTLIHVIPTLRRGIPSGYAPDPGERLRDFLRRPRKRQGRGKR